MFLSLRDLLLHISKRVIQPNIVSLYNGVYTGIHIHIYIHRYIYILIYIYIYTCTRVNINIHADDVAVNLALRDT